VVLDELCQVSKKLGLKAIDLLGPKDFATVKKYGLVVSMVNGPALTDGFADKKFTRPASPSCERASTPRPKPAFRT